MKSAYLKTTFLALSLLSPAAAMAAGSCEPKGVQLSTAQRTAYIKQCLADSAAPASVQRAAQQHKEMSCEQNARNKALQGTAKSSYVAKCMIQNDARDAVEASSAGRLQRSYSAYDGMVSIR